MNVTTKRDMQNTGRNRITLFYTCRPYVLAESMPVSGREQLMFTLTANENLNDKIKSSPTMFTFTEKLNEDVALIVYNKLGGLTLRNACCI